MKLCLLDANVVIHLHELGLWELILDRCEVFLASTVCDEAMFWTDAGGNEHPIALKRGTYEEISAKPTELAALKREFPGFQIDAGELESLAWRLSGANRPKARMADR